MDGRPWLVAMRPSPGEVTLRRRGRPERASTPLAHALYIPPLSPPHLLRLVLVLVYSCNSATVWLLTEHDTEGPPLERSGEGGSSLPGTIPTQGGAGRGDSERGESGPCIFASCIEHKGPPSTKNMHTKDDHDSRGRNYKAETQLPTFAWASLPI